MNSMLRELDRLRLEYDAVLTKAEEVDNLLRGGGYGVGTLPLNAHARTAKRLNSPRLSFLPFALARVAKVRAAVRKINGEIEQRQREIRGRELALEKTNKDERDARSALENAKADLAAGERERDRLAAELDAFRENHPRPRSNLSRTGNFDPELVRLIRAKAEQRGALRRILVRIKKEQERLGAAIQMRVALSGDIRSLRVRVEALIRRRRKLNNL